MTWWSNLDHIAGFTIASDQSVDIRLTADFWGSVLHLDGDDAKRFLSAVRPACLGSWKRGLAETKSEIPV